MRQIFTGISALAFLKGIGNALKTPWALVNQTSTLHTTTKSIGLNLSQPHTSTCNQVNLPGSTNVIVKTPTCTFGSTILVKRNTFFGNLLLKLKRLTSI